MQINFLGELATVGQLDWEVSTLPELISLLKVNFPEVYTTLQTSKYHYLLVNSTNPKDTVPILLEVFHTDFQHYDCLFIMPEIEGDAPAFIIGLLEAAGTSAVIGTVGTTVLGYAISIGIMIGASYALSALMNSIAPTGTFAGDPAFMQDRLFNGAPLTTEIGGSVPLSVGRPFCSGVLISSGVRSGNF